MFLYFGYCLGKQGRSSFSVTTTEIELLYPASFNIKSSEFFLGSYLSVKKLINIPWGLLKWFVLFFLLAPSF